MKRSLLHKSKLEDFKSWCATNNIQTKMGKGHFQVLQVLTKESGWQVIYDRLDGKEHFTVNAKLLPIVRKFVNAIKAQEKVDG